MNLDEMIGRAYDEILDEELLRHEKIPDHVFSKKFEKRMTKLFKKAVKTSRKRPASRKPLNKHLVFAIILLSLLALTGAAIMIIRIIGSFYVEEHDIFSYLGVNDAESAPAAITEHYRPDIDLSDYTSSVLSDDFITYLAEYKDEKTGKWLSFEQGIKIHFQGVRLDTENAVEMPCEIIINDVRGVYYETSNNIKTIFWDNGDYIFSISAKNFSKDELIQMACFVQKAE